MYLSRRSHNLVERAQGHLATSRSRANRVHYMIHNVVGINAHPMQYHLWRVMFKRNDLSTEE